LATDKVTNVRIEFAKSLLDLKPYLESNQTIMMQLHEIVE